MPSCIEWRRRMKYPGLSWSLFGKSCVTQSCSIDARNMSSHLLTWMLRTYFPSRFRAQTQGLAPHLTRHHSLLFVSQAYYTHSYSSHDPCIETKEHIVAVSTTCVEYSLSFVKLELYEDAATAAPKVRETTLAPANTAHAKSGQRQLCNPTTFPEGWTIFLNSSRQVFFGHVKSGMVCFQIPENP